MAELDITDFKHPISAVTFDLYATLLISDPTVDQTKLAAQVFSRSLRLDGVELSEEATAEYFTYTFERGHSDEFTIFEQRIDNFLVSKGIQAHKSSIHRYASDILDSWASRWNLADDTVRVISELSRSGVSVGLVTNFDHFPHIRDLVAESELVPLLDIVVISSEVGFDKPDARIFASALTLLNVASENTVHVGDDIVDVEGALGVGMQVVQIDRHSPPNSKGLVEGRRTCDSRVV